MTNNKITTILTQIKMKTEKIKIKKNELMQTIIKKICDIKITLLHECTKITNAETNVNNI